MDEEIQYRIDYIRSIFFLTAAVMADLLRLILNLFTVGIAANRFISPIVNLIFITLFKMRGITFTKPKPKKGLTGSAWKMIASFLLSFIPGLDFTIGLFASTMSTYSIISSSRYEDKVAAKKKKSTSLVSKLANKTTGRQFSSDRLKEAGAKAPKVGSEIGKSSKPKEETADIQAPTNVHKQEAEKPKSNPEPSHRRQETQPERAEFEEVGKENAQNTIADDSSGEGTLEDIVMDKDFDPYREEAA